MKICICSNLSEDDIRNKIRELKKKYNWLTLSNFTGSQCGSCTSQIQKIAKEDGIE